MKTIFFFVVIIFYSSIIYPCSCLFQHPSEAYEKAQLIFIGLSISVGEDSISFYRFKSLFKVERIFKGEELSEVEILSDISSCGVYFPSGYKFLIYSYKSKDGYYYTGKCTRSNILKSAIIDLIFLNSLPEALNQSSLAGHLYNYEDVNKDYWDLPPFDYTPVMIFNDKKIYETVTDKNGLYKFENIDPGMYKFKFGVSSKYTTQFSFDELIDIKQNEFKEINQILVPNGIICGHLKDINGKALQRVFVDLMPVNELISQSYFLDGSSLTDTSGYFYFNRIPSGEYYLGINLTSYEPLTLRFIRTYYPGVDNFSEAELIKIEFGDSVGGIQFQIPSDKSIYYLKGYVLFEDTTFRLGGEVQLRTTNDFTNSDLIEKSSINVYNKFSMMLLEGMEGWIHFKITGLYPKSETNPEIEIPEPFYFKPEKDIVDMKVIIHKKNGK